MFLSEIPRKVSHIKKIYETSDPFKIAKSSGIQVKYGDYGKNVFGFYTMKFRIKFIFLNIMLSHEEEKFTCAHELMHSFLHPTENTPALSRSTLNSTSKIEAQANKAATLLLIDGEHESELYNPTNLEILRYYNLPIEMEKYL